MEHPLDVGLRLHFNFRHHLGYDKTVSEAKNWLFDIDGQVVYHYFSNTLTKQCIIKLSLNELHCPTNAANNVAYVS